MTTSANPPTGQDASARRRYNGSIAFTAALLTSTLSSNAAPAIIFRHRKRAVSVMVTPRQQSILESVANREVVYGTHFNGFYYNRVLQFELAAEDQAFLRTLYETGAIWHKPIDSFDFEVCLTDAITPGDS